MIDGARIQKKIIELLSSSNLQEEFSNLSYDEKVYVLKFENPFLNILIENVSNIGLHFFNREESLKIINDKENIPNFKKIILPLIDLPDDILIETFSNSESPFFEGLEIRQRNEYMYSFFKYVNNSSNLLEYIDKLPYELVVVALKFLSDEDLEQLLYRKLPDNLVTDIIKNFKDDKYKLFYLKRFGFKGRGRAIASLSDDNLVKFITPFSLDKGEMISNLSSDVLKEEYLNRYRFFLRAGDVTKILLSFKDSDLYVVRNHYLLKREVDIYEFIKYYNWNIEVLKVLLSRIKKESFLVNILLYSNLLYEKDVDFVKSIIDRIQNPKNIYKLYEEAPAEWVDYLLGKLPQKYVQKYVRENSDELNSYKVLLKLEDDDLLFAVLPHYQFSEKYSDDMYPLFALISKKYQLNLSHLIDLVKLTGCSIVPQLANVNVRDAINLDEGDFQKYLNLFSETNLIMSKGAFSSIANSFLSKEFNLRFSNQIVLINNIKSAIRVGDFDVAYEKVKLLIKDDYFMDFEALWNSLLNDRTIDYYSEINSYLIQKRNKYVNDNAALRLIRIANSNYEVNALSKLIFKCLSADQIYHEICMGISEDKKEKYDILLSNKTLLFNLINFKKTGCVNNVTNTVLNKKYLNLFGEMMKDAIKESAFYSVWSNSINSVPMDNIPVQSEFNAVDNNRLVQLVSNIDVNKLKSTIFTSDSLYKELLSYLGKYRILALDSEFTLLTEKIDILLSPILIASFISNFGQITKKKNEYEQKNYKVTLSYLFSLAELLYGDFSNYESIFGSENYQFLKLNPMPNSSPFSMEKRLEIALDRIHVMHNRRYITVPPISKVFSLGDNKKIEVTLGDTDNSINLTLGERTKSCMRIGGAGNSLFDFCLENENGFHIIYRNPETGDFITRVSCIRNGNTVFLNEVRHATSYNYTDIDIQKATRLIGEEIINSTRNSQYPILNVVTTNTYAFSGMPTKNIGVSNPTKGFNLGIYTDFKETAVVVAAKDNVFSPIKLGPTECERYPVSRSAIRAFELEKAVSAISAIETRDAYLSGKPLNEISIVKKNVIMAYVGGDWYVALLDTGECISYLSKSSNNKEAATAEMQYYLTLINNYKFDIDSSGVKLI